jgi:starvation-inducible DNA-binding protein
MSDNATQMTTLLSTIIDFYYTYKFFHWNLIDSDFIEYHQLFDSHATLVYESQDVIAERMRQLGEPVVGLLTDYHSYSKLTHEKPEARNNMPNILKFITTQHEITIKLLEETIDSAAESKDFSTADILTKFLQDHQKMHWFIKSSIVS